MQIIQPRFLLIFFDFRWCFVVVLPDKFAKKIDNEKSEKSTDIQ